MVARRRGGYAWLRPWPLLIAAIAAFSAGTRLLTDENDRELAAAALIAIGSICIGAWITMLAAHDYPGRETPYVEPPGADTPSAERPGDTTEIPTDADSARPRGHLRPGPSRPPTQDNP